MWGCVSFCQQNTRVHACAENQPNLVYVAVPCSNDGELNAILIPIQFNGCIAAGGGNAIECRRTVTTPYVLRGS